VRRGVRLALAALLAAALAGAPAALANGDPASDILPLRDSYLPYQPQVPRPVQVALDGFLAKARKAGYPVKVAVIATPNDLGVVPDLFGKPKEYATFLGKEISFNGKPHLLIVMPAGYGTFGVVPKVASAVTGLRAPGGTDGATLGTAAIAGAVKMTEAAGHKLPAPKVGGGSGGGGSTPVVVFAIPAILVAVGAFWATRRATREESAT
jgi:hypothetical protein